MYRWHVLKRWGCELHGLLCWQHVGSWRVVVYTVHPWPVLARGVVCLHGLPTWSVRTDQRLRQLHTVPGWHLHEHVVQLGMQSHLRRRLLLSCGLDELHRSLVRRRTVQLQRCRELHVVRCWQVQLCWREFVQPVCRWPVQYGGVSLHRVPRGDVWQRPWADIVSVQWQLHRGLLLSSWLNELRDKRVSHGPVQRCRRR